MRVPPDQSTTCAEQAASASSGSRWRIGAGDVGQPRAEQEGGDALARVGHRMQEMQEQPGVLAHRAGNIEQRHDRRLLLARPEIFQVDHRAARLHAGAQRAADVDQLAAARGGKPARAHQIERQRQPRDRLLGGGDLGRASSARNPSSAAPRGRTRSAARRSRPRTSRSRRSRPANSASWMRCAPGGGAFGAPGRRLRQHGGDQLVDIAALAEEHAEGLVEQNRVLVPLHEHRVQRPVEIVAVADARDAHRFERVEHRARPDRHAGGAQRAREVEDVFGEAALPSFTSPACGGGRPAKRGPGGGFTAAIDSRFASELPPAGIVARMRGSVKLTPPRAAPTSPRRAAP